MAEPPDLRRILDRLFTKTEQSESVAGHALFDKKPAAPIPKAPAVTQARLIQSRWQQLLLSLKTLGKGDCGRVVGIDLGASAIKVVQVQRKDSLATVTGVACEEYPPEMNQEDRPAFLEERLKRLKQQGMLEGQLVFGIADDKVVTESLTLPKMPPQDLNRAVLFEAKERLNAESTTHCVRHLVIGEEEVQGQEQMEVLLFCVERQEVVPTYHLLASQGPRVAAAEPGILADAGALEAAGRLPEKRLTAILDIGQTHSALVCIVEGKVRLIRSFSISGDTITQSIVEYCQVDRKTAEEEKKAVGLTQTPAAEAAQRVSTPQGVLQVRVSHAMALNLERLATEVDHSLRYLSYYTIGRGTPSNLEFLALVGGGAQLKNLVGFLSKRLNTRIEMVDPFQTCVVSNPVRETLKKQISPMRLTKALGLAMRPIGVG